MASAYDLFQQGRKDEIWSKYCGFMDLGLSEFMDIQQRLMMEQLGLLGQCELGRRMFGSKMPATIDEFRARVPLTTYDDYSSVLDAQDESQLPGKPRWWLRTSGRTGVNGGFKWVPYTHRMAQKLGETVLALFTLASCSGRREFPFDVGDRMLFTMAPFPYMSGGVARAVLEEFPFSYLPPLERAEEMEFQERIQEGFFLALDQGMEAMNAIAIVLMRIGEQFMAGSGGMGLKTLLTRPRALVRIVRGLMRARLDGRNHLLPKDIWRVKGIATGGTDTAVFRDRIEEIWGATPVEAFGCTEAGLYSLQLWNGKGMTFLPDISFLEFLPFDEEAAGAARQGPGSTVLLDEVQVGGIYETVVSNLHGGAFVRYRTGDLIKISAEGDAELGVHLPQMVFHAKSADIIDLGSFSRLTERTVWQAIEGAQVSYADWVARKEIVDGKPVLAVYLEPNGRDLPEAEVKRRLHEALCEVDPPFSDMEQMMEMDPLRLVLLPHGAFKRFAATRIAAGADMAHLKPAHINPRDQDLALLRGQPLARS